MRLIPRRRKAHKKTPWEQMLISEARRHAVADRVELEALEADILEHGAPVAAPAAAGRPSLRRLLGRLRRRR